MADADLQITVGVDASAVQPGVTQTLDSLQAIKPGLDGIQAEFRACGAAITQALVRPDVSGVQAATAAVAAVAAEAATSMRTLTASIEADQRLEAERIRTSAQADQVELQDRERTLSAEVRMGQLSGAEELAARQALVEQRFTIEENAAEQQLASVMSHQERIKALWAEGTRQYQQAVDAEARAQTAFYDQDQIRQAQYLAQKRQNDLNYLQQLEQQWRGYVSPVVSSWGSAMTQMLQGTRTFGQAVTQVGQSILQVFVGIGERLVQDWLTRMIASQLASKTAGASEVASNAAVAGSAAFASTAAIPIVGPELAPAAGFSAHAEAMSFQGFLAEGGFDVPAGLTPLTLLHPREMVLPAHLANPLREMIAAGGSDVGSSGGSAIGGQGGDTHHWHVSAMDARGVQQFFDAHGDKLIRTLNSRLRNNARLAVA